MREFLDRWVYSSPMSYIKSSHQNEVAQFSKSSWPSSLLFAPFFSIVPAQTMPKCSLSNFRFVYLRELAAYTQRARR